MDSLEIVKNELTAPIEAAGYTVRRGWNNTIATQLVELSLQPHIEHMTPNDADRRFTTVEAAHQWYAAHERAVYTLGHSAVAGLIWFGRTEESEHGDYTFAIRMYEEAQGKHLARPFMQAAHADFLAETPDAPSIWLDTRIDNERAAILYEKVGYTTIDRIDDRYVMIYTPK
jgi:Acetyltransferases